MKLGILLRRIGKEIPPGCKGDMDIAQISCDSRTLKKDSLFIAVEGVNSDGRDFIDEAISRGAVCVVAREGRVGDNSHGVLVLSFSDTRFALAALSDEFYGHPSGDIKVVGVTGTNGKTTVTYAIDSILREAGFSTGLIGTINYRIKDDVVPAVNTTPCPPQLYSLLRQMVDSGCAYCTLEVSSHGLDQKRVEAVDFEAAVFTNLTQDHLDYHKSMDDYFLAKSRLFSGLNPKAYAIINRDSPFACRLIGLSAQAKLVTYALDSSADFMARGIVLGLDYSEFTVEAKGIKAKIKTSLIGRHNILNLLAGAAFAVTQGIEIKYIKKGIESLKGVRGRLEKIDCRGKSIFIDYAHTPDALENILGTLRRFAKNKLFVVFGCGGERDSSKRPLMGQVVERYADCIFITSDNPRSEDPEKICREIASGIKRKSYSVILDRREAISNALSESAAGDIILIAGKGHEGYQVFKGRKLVFDDRKVVEECLNF